MARKKRDLNAKSGKLHLIILANAPSHNQYLNTFLKTQNYQNQKAADSLSM